MKQSKKFDLNWGDIRNQIKASIVWLAPLVVLYIAQLQGALMDHKTLTLADLTPNSMTVGAVQLYVINQAFGLFNKFVSGK